MSIHDFSQDKRPAFSDYSFCSFQDIALKAFDINFDKIDGLASNDVIQGFDSAINLKAVIITGPPKTRLTRIDTRHIKRIRPV